MQLSVHRIGSNVAHHSHVDSGYPLDIVVCSALGADMYDSVYPTRTARFGVGLTHDGLVKLKTAQYATDLRPVDPECNCLTCQKYSRAALHGLFTRGTVVGGRLLTYHNIAYMMRLSREMQEAIKQHRFPDYVRRFVSRLHPDGNIPDWVEAALEAAGISLRNNT